MVLHVARKLKDTPEDDPGCQKEARPDPDDKADDVKAKPDESEDGGESAEDDDDDPAVDEAERDPEPAAPARKDLLIPALILASPRLLGKQAVGRPLDWFQSTCAEGFEKLVNPLPVREDPVLLFYIIHEEISEEHIYQLTLLNYQLLKCFSSNDVNWDRFLSRISICRTKLTHKALLRLYFEMEHKDHQRVHFDALRNIFTNRLTINQKQTLFSRSSSLIHLYLIAIHKYTVLVG